MFDFLKRLFTKKVLEDSINEKIFNLLIQDISNPKNTKVLDTKEKTFILLRGKQLIFKVDISSWELKYPIINNKKFNKKQIKIFKKKMK